MYFTNKTPGCGLYTVAAYTPISFSKMERFGNFLVIFSNVIRLYTYFRKQIWMIKLCSETENSIYFHILFYPSSFIHIAHTYNYFHIRTYLYRYNDQSRVRLIHRCGLYTGFKNIFTHFFFWGGGGGGRLIHRCGLYIGNYGTSSPQHRFYPPLKNHITYALRTSSSL